jgi:hypothetical protein
MLPQIRRRCAAAFVPGDVHTPFPLLPRDGLIQDFYAARRCRPMGDRAELALELAQRTGARQLDKR